MPEPDPFSAVAGLSDLLTGQQLRHALNEAAWAGRLLLNAAASLVFLPAQGDLVATAWHGREADGLRLNPAASSTVRMMAAGRRSLAWESRGQCHDGEIAEILGSLSLQSGLAVPLRLAEKLVGLWIVGDSGRRAFGSHDELALHTLAENVGLTIGSLLLSAEAVRSRQEADALSVVAREIAQLRDLDQALQAVASQASALLQAELSYIALTDPTAGEVRVRVTHGTRSDALRTMVLRLGEGIGGQVASTRLPMLVDDYPNDPRPKPPGVADLAATEEIVSIACVPMEARQTLVGVLFAASRRRAAFSPHQLGLLNALGAHAAIAIENARLYEAEKQAAEALRTLNMARDHERGLLEASIKTHEQLLKLVLDNQGTQAIADTLSELVACPVLVEDHRFRSVCCSLRGCPALSEARFQALREALTDAPVDSELRGQLGRLRAVHRAAYIPAQPERRRPYGRLIAPIVTGDALVGYVTALEVEQAIGEQARSAVEQASIVLALEFLKQEAARATEQRVERDFLDDLFFARRVDDPTLPQRAARLGVDLRQPQRALIFDIDEFGSAVTAHGWSDVEAMTVKRSLLTAVSEVARSWGISLVAGRRGDSVVALAAEHGGLADVRSLAAAVQEALRPALADLTVSVGIGRPAQGPAEFPRSYQDAAGALRAIRALGGRQRVVAFEELGVTPLLLQSGDQQGLVQFMERHLRPLLEYDGAHGTQFLLTLDRFLWQNGNLQRTAEACFLHLNSLKYRIRRISEIGGLDLDDADTRFNLRLALAIRSALRLLRDEP